MGATTEVAIDRVARLADGYLAVSNMYHAFEGLTTPWTMLKPRLEKYHRNIALLPIACCIHLWVSDDPDREWTTMLAPAMEHQINVYSRMGTEAGQPIPTATDLRMLPRHDI